MFCEGGVCLLCQLREPIVAGASTSLRPPPDEGRSRRVPPKVNQDGTRGDTVPSAPTFDAGHGTQFCPLCRQPFKELHHHYRKKHPGKLAPGRNY